jgi:threonine dehydrogenase-like Zn-dependent dehydrogenase
VSRPLDRVVKRAEDGRMRAAIARRGRMVVEEVPEPTPGPGDALVAVRSCGICGSDLHTLHHADSLLTVAELGGGESSFDPNHDFVMGHEYSGEVVELGPETDGAPVAVGDLVVSMPFAMVGAGIEPIGFSNTYNGAYADRMRLTAGLCLKVPNGLDARRAALTEPMTVGLHAVNKSGIKPGEGALVLGCGPVGLAVIAALKSKAIEPIVATDFSARRRAMATAMGAHEVVTPTEEPAIEAWRRVGGARAVVLFEAIGVPGIIDQAMRDAPPLSRIVIVGVCMETDHMLPLVGIVKELNLQFTFYYDPVEFGETLRSIAEGELDVTPMITGVVGVDGVPGAFDALANPDEQVKILVEPGASAEITAV